MNQEKTFEEKINKEAQRKGDIYIEMAQARIDDKQKYTEDFKAKRDTQVVSVDVVLKAYEEEQEIEQNLRGGLAQTCTKLNFKIEYLEREIANMKEVNEARKQKLPKIIEKYKKLARGDDELGLLCNVSADILQLFVEGEG